MLNKQQDAKPMMSVTNYSMHVSLHNYLFSLRGFLANLKKKTKTANQNVYYVVL